MSSSPEVIIRIGSHAEKEYVLKLARFFDGVILGSNLFEATPGATASLLLAVAGQRTKFYLDPMTYAFGTYVDPVSRKVRTDLDWIKSDQVRKDGRGRKISVRDFKRSYRALADQIGEPLVQAVQTSIALSPTALSAVQIRERFCRGVAEYQLTRILREFEADEELKNFIANVPRPAVVFAPYFYIEPSKTEEWLELNLQLIDETIGLNLGVPVHAVLCADVAHLRTPRIRKRILEALPKTHVSGVWLWFSSFFEESESRETLAGYRDLVAGLAKDTEVHAMHGGFLSLALSKYGMSGVSHGVGYGEQKNVEPVIGQSTPTVRYYLPALTRRLAVPDIERAFDALGVKTPQDFYEKVCGCAVCRGIVSNSLEEFSSFGDRYFSRPDARRLAQTPAAAKRCRFHFLLSRLQEKDDVPKLSVDQIRSRMQNNSKTWGAQPSLAGSSNHLSIWAEVLAGTSQQN